MIPTEALARDLTARKARCEHTAVSIEQVAQHALALSERERAELAHKLLLSLDAVAEEGVEEAWDAEIAERVRKIHDGTAKGRPAEEVFRDLRSRYQ